MQYPFFPSVAIVANGEIRSLSETQQLLSHYPEVVAVDGGLNYCDSMEIIPNLIIGDLDSVCPKILEKYSNNSILRYPLEKDESDLELAIIELIRRGVPSIALFGVLGKRIDHLLYTLNLLARYPSQLIIFSETETIFCLQKENHIISKQGQTLSLIPLNSVLGVSTKGLKWEVKNARFNKNFMSLSNICINDSFYVSLESGDLLCCLQSNPS